MMAGWDRVADWLAALVVASLTWVSGLAVDLPGDPSAAQGLSVARENPALMLGWAQEAETPPIEPLDDATGDVETLDESAPPARDDQPAGDTTSVAAAPAAEEDIELLDQGSPPAALPAVAPPASTTYIAPPPTGAATAYVPPAESVATGPVLPPGFGTGQVHVNAGSAEFPAGLADCHVGAVTGRAYVGIDCGEEGDDSFVGHAPTFEDFPFVVVGDFPFDDRDVELDDPGFPFTTGNDDGFPFTTGNAVAEDDSDVFVTAARPPTSPSDEPNANPVIEMSGAATAQFAQRARDRDPRARAENQSDKAANESGKDKGKNKDKKGTSGARADSASADSQSSAQSNDDTDTRHNADKKKQRAKDDSKHERDKGKAKNKNKDKDKDKDKDKKAKQKKSNHERSRHKRN